jgi:hypothetical protein
MSIRDSFRKRAVLGAVAAVAVAAPVMVVGTAGTAAAHAACGQSAPNLDPGAAYYTANAVNVRSGSGTDCALLGISYISQPLDYYCYTLGNDGYTWTYARNTATGVRGWLRDDLLDDYGSSYYCGF